MSVRNINGNTNSSSWEASGLSTPKTPSDMGGAMVTTAIVGAIADIANGFISAAAEKNTAKFNKGMADVQARMTMNAAKYDIKQIRRRSDELFSKQRTLYAKAGVTLDGSPAEVMIRSLQQGEQDALITGINAEYAAYGIRANAEVNNMSADSAYTRAGINAGKTILDLGIKYVEYEYLKGLK